MAKPDAVRIVTLTEDELEAMLERAAQARRTARWRFR